jgi:hypothetical protein
MNMNSVISESDDSRFNEWAAESVARNPNLKPLAIKLGNFTPNDFAAWLEKALIRIVIEGKPEEAAFSPGELIIGTSPSGWRDDLFAVIALLEESAKASVVRGIVQCFDGIAPRPSDNDITAQFGQNWEQYAVELMRLVRDLRPPLCDREATPLVALLKLLNTTFPNSQAVLDEGLLLWRAFAHQIQDAEIWISLFERHPRFHDEYTPLVAFAHAVRFPENTLYYLTKWKPYHQYRCQVLHEAVLDSNAKGYLQELYGATDNVVQYANERGIRIKLEDIAVDSTYAFHEQIRILQTQEKTLNKNTIVYADTTAFRRHPLRIDELFRDSSAPNPHAFDKYVPNVLRSAARIGVGV